MSKKILFVINNMHCGGAENSLISLLQVIDYSKYDIHLLLFKKEGFFLNNIPKQVVLLDPISEFNYFDTSFTKSFFSALLKFRFDIIYAKLAFLFHKKIANPAVREQKFWKYLSVCIPKRKDNFDVAIGFLEKTPNYYIVDKVNATKKMGFIRTDYEAMGMLKEIDLPYFEKLNYILANSTNAELSLKKIFPQFIPKIKTIENFFSPETLIAMSEEKIDLKKGELTIVSVGRLHPVKGYDFAIEACKIIKDKGIDVKWLVIGDGGERAELEELIKRNEVQDNFILLGMKENPHPYIKMADLFVQTSRFEGKSRAIEEAKIHKKPILVTNYPSVNNQITHNQNGFVVQMNAISIAEGILHLHNDKELKIKLISNLQLVFNDNEAQLKRLYDLID
jgi:glycosyltransferase involved in cell wall biosynthesis